MVRGRRVIGALVAVMVLAGCSPTVLPRPATQPPSSPSPVPTIGSSPSPASSHVAITKDRAIAIARRAATRWATASVLQADKGPFGELGFSRAPVLVLPAPSPEHLVWLINLGVVRGPLNADGTDVIIDATDGSVLQLVDWIS